MINISEYLTTQTPLPPFLPYPRFLLELDLSQTAKMTYALLLDRATLSQKNLWTDERGFVFVIFTICSLAEQLGRSTVSVSSALKELDAAGLIERRRTRSYYDYYSPAWPQAQPIDSSGVEFDFSHADFSLLVRKDDKRFVFTPNIKT